MEIRDVIHGVIQIEPHEIPIIDSQAFQRLRLIKAMGFAENSYPGASHSRYTHSLGAFYTASLIFDSIFSKLKDFHPGDYARFRAAVRIAALLHDIGHGPLSHTTESAMPQISALKIPGVSSVPKKSRASHEDYTLKIILDSSLTPILEQQLEHFGILPRHIVALINIDYPLDSSDAFFQTSLQGEKTDLRPILSQIISSEIDADRMDYLRRDSFYSGVSYGVFDWAWILNNLTYHVQKNKCYLALNHKALYAFEDFLLSRYHMFLMVYLHHKTVIYDEMLNHYFQSPDCTYHLPSEIEDYLNKNDAELFAHLSKSKNFYAKRIVNKKPLQMILETHSGIPNTPKAQENQEELFKKTITFLKNRKIDFIESKSHGVLSKYFGKAGNPIYVHYDNLLSHESFIPLEKCTPLFTQYPQVRSISRIYVPTEKAATLKQEIKFC